MVGIGLDKKGAGEESRRSRKKKKKKKGKRGGGRGRRGVQKVSNAALKRFKKNGRVVSNDSYNPKKILEGRGKRERGKRRGKAGGKTL